MSGREEIERVLDQAYAARARQDLDGMLECFHPDARFHANGSDAPALDRPSQRAAIGGILETFQLLDFQQQCRVIDPPRAVVHWRGRFKANNTGHTADADVLDLIEVRDGRIAALTTFFDTALSQQLTVT
jgi:ketosteroid isomerase-like protein